MTWIKMILKFLNDNLGLVTFVVGFSAIYIYLRQKKDRKRDAARLILQEIRYAEQQIRNFRNAQTYSLASKLLPTNSWNNNIHFFVKDLTETEIDVISAFYSKANYIDSLIMERSKQRTNLREAPTPVNPAASPSVTGQSPLPEEGGPQQIAQRQVLTTGQSPLLEEGGPQQITQRQVVTIVENPTRGELITIQLLADVSLSVEFLYNTPAAEKLRKMSERKWYSPV